MTNEDYKIIKKAAMIEASCILPIHYQVSEKFFKQVMKRFQHDKQLREVAIGYFKLEVEHYKGDAS